MCISRETGGSFVQVAFRVWMGGEAGETERSKGIWIL